MSKLDRQSYLAAMTAVYTEASRIEYKKMDKNKPHVSIFNSKQEEEEFTRWQFTYNTSIHSYITGTENLDLKTFRAGGLITHKAPRCFQCDPIIEVEDA
jgi:hypothetical protein